MPSEYLARLAPSPLDPVAYFDAGKAEYAKYPRRPFAHALFRSARYLEPALPGIEQAITCALASLPPATILSPNSYVRNRKLAEELGRLKPAKGPCSVVDIGGARGLLARFLGQEDDYFLADPNVNGLYGESAPLPDRYATFAVSSHVLEHVLPEHRVAFLDNMARIARNAFIILVPVQIGGAHRVTERLNFFIEMTDAKWAKEHLACGHPTPEFFETYAKEKGLCLNVRSVISSSAACALVLAAHYAKLSPRKNDISRVHRFFNEHFYDALADTQESDQLMFTFMPRQPN